MIKIIQMYGFHMKNRTEYEMTKDGMLLTFYLYLGVSQVYRI